jgi:hypothetical protein
MVEIPAKVLDKNGAIVNIAPSNRRNPPIADVTKTGSK